MNGLLVVSPDELAALIEACGHGAVNVDTIRDDLKRGAPSLEGGTKLDLLHYLAWLMHDRPVPTQTDAEGA